MSFDAWLIAAVVSPFVAVPFAGWLGGRRREYARLLALLPAALSAYFAYGFWVINARGPVTAVAPWAPSLHLSLSFQFDGLSALFAALISIVGTLIVVYAATYLDGHPHAGRFHASLLGFMGSMLGLVLSDNAIALFVFWELTGFTSYLLIGFDHDRPEARRAATQALIVTGGGGLALLAAAILLVQAGGTASLSELAGRGAVTGSPFYPGIVALVLLAAFTKSAQFPFHFWLPNAMQAPTPVSAYLHSATMVKAGVYLVARMTPILGGSLLWTGTITLVGAATMIGGSYLALLETDLKRILAYSTISALGALMLLLGMGTPIAAAAALVHLVAHACYKGALFLIAGAVEHETGTRDVTALRGLRRTMPITALAAALAAASMAGIPLFAGFVAKELVLESVTTLPLSVAVMGLAVAGVVLAGAWLTASGLAAGVGPFAGSPGEVTAAHDAPPSLRVGPLALGIAGLVIGVLPGLISVPIALASAVVTPAASPVKLGIWHGLTINLALSGVTLAASLAIYRSRDAIRRWRWPAALSTDRMYAAVLSAIDAVAHRAGPVLQSGSLRSYVLTILVTAVAFVAAALVAGRVFPEPGRWTPIRFHEGVVATLIMAGAVSATLARSTMVAVLSLGAVGYGIALLYALLGAPDLAMTQFAVETLTVVIFVLVFYQLRGFGDLSSRAVKTRDGLVALAAGILVTTLVLFIGASGTISRLSAYFANAAPALGHGRNVVNVILVDFRGFDTLGEITVLVTVAIGVRALLLINKERGR